MGFEQVYEYEDGKRDWGSFGLPREGRVAEQPSAGDLARADVPTCLLTDSLSEVRRRVRESGWETCIVVNDHRVVLGRLGRRAIGSWLVTTPDGKLVGLVLRSQAEERLRSEAS